jgi:hypothetical protein
MNITSIVLATLGGFVAYMVIGGILFAALPALKNEFSKYPGVYRSGEGMKKTMPAAMASIFVAIVVLVVMYAMIYQGGAGIAEGARLGALVGALIGVFSVCIFSMHNYSILNIGLKLTLLESAAYFVQWVCAGIAIGLIYRPPTLH